MTVLADRPSSVDARGLSCPMPIVKTAQAVKPLASGAIVEVLATDPGSQGLRGLVPRDRPRAGRADHRGRRPPLRHPPEVRPRHDHVAVRPDRRADRRRRGLAEAVAEDARGAPMARRQAARARDHLLQR